jgi:hypothetical protein
VSATFSIVGATQILATSPSGSAGPVDVIVSTSTGASATTPADQFTYLKATAQVSLGNLSAIYNGAAHPVTVTVTPLTVNYTVTYNGSSTAPTAAGTYQVAVTVNDPNYRGSATGTLVITQATPTLNWKTPVAITYGTALSAAQLDATASVAGGFAYTPLAGTVLSGGQQQLSVLFTPSDTIDYVNAQAKVTLTVNPAQQTISFGKIASQTQDGSLELSATASSGLSVGFTSSTPTVCTVSGSTAKMIAPGTCTIVASQSGSNNFGAAKSVTQSFSVSGFTINITPGTETIARGVLAAFLLEVNSSNGFSGDVKITCSGGPSDSICGEFPQTVKVNANKTSLALSGVLFPAKTTPGTYTLTFTGTSGAATSTATATFTVKE